MITKAKLETEAGLLRWGLFAEFKRENISIEKYKNPKQKNKELTELVEDDNSATWKIYISEQQTPPLLLLIDACLASKDWLFGILK